MKTSGYTDCACRDCFEIAITSGGPALCHECAGAGCEAHDHETGKGAECQRSDTYDQEEGE